MVEPALTRPGRNGATVAGFVAIVMWSMLALLTGFAVGVPIFQTLSISFTIGTLVGLLWYAVSADRGALWPGDGQWPAYVAGIAGLFGYHFLYFLAISRAPIVEASLIAYLWPLLIVIGSALLPGEKLGVHHIAGAVLGLAGTAVLITGGSTLAIDPRHVPGHLFALAAAVTWAAYSLLARRFSAVPTSAVIVFCAAAAVLSGMLSLAVETGRHIWPLTGMQWLGLAGLGLLPLGAAFYFWDHGVKHGNIQLVGTFSYAAPLLSTLILLVFDPRVVPHPTMAFAALLVTAGAVLAANPAARARRSRN